MNEQKTEFLHEVVYCKWLELSYVFFESALERLKGVEDPLTGSDTKILE